MSRTPFPTPVAGTYYPIYNSGTNQYIPPSPDMPLDKVSVIFVAFAHAYAEGKGAVLRLEADNEPPRLVELVRFARHANPGIKILISLGWGHNDWTFIASDYASGINQFPASVVALIRQYGLDGFDIDDEGISTNPDYPGSSGVILQSQFNGVIQNLRNALDAAAAQDGKPYFLTVAPAGRTAQITDDNMNFFDLINPQCYGGSVPSDFTALGYPAARLTWGIDTEPTSPVYPSPSEYQGLAGIYNWTLSADSNHGYQYTRRIARDVGYGRPSGPFS